MGKEMFYVVWMPEKLKEMKVFSYILILVDCVQVIQNILTGLYTLK